MRSGSDDSLGYARPAVENNESTFQKQYCIVMTLNYKDTCKYSRKKTPLFETKGQSGNTVW